MAVPEIPLPTPRFKLFSPGNIGVASFLGSVLAGSILLALNYRRLGRGRHAAISLGVGVAVTLTMVVLAFVTPESPSRIWTFVTILLALGMKQVTEVAQGKELQAHTAAGGQVGAGWATAGIAMACLGIAVFAIFAAVVLTEPDDFGDQVSSGNQHVYYKDGVTYAEARAVFDVLFDEGYFDSEDHPADVQVVRRAGTPHIVFVVRDPAVDDAEVEDSFRGLGRVISERAFAGAPVVVDLADDTLEVGRRITVE